MCKHLSLNVKVPKFEYDDYQLFLSKEVCKTKQVRAEDVVANKIALDLLEKHFPLTFKNLQKQMPGICYSSRQHTQNPELEFIKLPPNPSFFLLRFSLLSFDCQLTFFSFFILEKMTFTIPRTVFTQTSDMGRTAIRLFIYLPSPVILLPEGELFCKVPTLSYKEFLPSALITQDSQLTPKLLTLPHTAFSAVLQAANRLWRGRSFSVSIFLSGDVPTGCLKYTFFHQMFAVLERT